MEKKKIKNTGDMGELPEGWEVKNLGSLFEFKNGINAGKEKYGQGFKFINVMEVIYNESINSQNIPGCVAISEDQKNAYLVKEGDVLFNRTSETTNEIGLSAVYQGKEEVVFGGFVIRGRPKDVSIDNEYKKYCFRSKFVRDQVIKGGQGAVRSNIGQGDLEKVKILLPPLPEQRAIAACLSVWDEAIQKTTQLIAQKERQKKWLMQQLLTGKRRLKGFEGAWKEYHLGDVFTERNETRHNDLPLLSIGQSGVYPQSESDKKDTSNDDKSKYKRICPGDIGYNTMRMWQGRSALSEIEGIVSPAYTIVTPKQNADSLFFSYLFRMPKMMHLFWRNSQGLVDDTLNCKFKDFAIIKVHLPLKREQTAIAHILQTADQEIQMLKAGVEKMKEQKRGVMQVLLTGKKRLLVEE